jgi:hypothetical protein
MNEMYGAYVVELRLGSAVTGSLYRIIPEALVPDFVESIWPNNLGEVMMKLQRDKVVWDIVDESSLHIPSIQSQILAITSSKPATTPLP